MEGWLGTMTQGGRGRPTTNDRALVLGPQGKRESECVLPEETPPPGSVRIDTGGRQGITPARRSSRFLHAISERLHGVTPHCIFRATRLRRTVAPMPPRTVAPALARDYAHSREGRALLIHADCLEWFGRIPEASLHVAVTDPPYG